MNNCDAKFVIEYKCKAKTILQQQKCKYYSRIYFPFASLSTLSKCRYYNITQLCDNEDAKNEAERFLILGMEKDE
jgi:hypothetical protein